MPAHNGVTKVLNAVGREMVSRGMNDRAIADELGCSSSLVAHWRTRNNIKTPAFPISARLNTIGIEMYREGCSDVDIARTVGCSVPNVRYWRTTRDLPAQCKPGSEEWYIRRDCTTRSETMLAVERGLTDSEAAKALGISRSAFTLRRNRLGLPPGRYERKPRSRGRLPQSIFTRCKHCDSSTVRIKKIRVRSRGLCSTCFADDAIRPQYPAVRE